MKKSVIALAVSAASLSAAQAQNIVVDGYIDRAYTVTNSTAAARDVTAISSSSGTSTIGFSGSEDLGGGMRASFRINTDFADQSGLNLDAAAATASSIQAGGFANSQLWLQVSDKQLGDLRLGTVNNQMLTLVTAVATPAFSTGVGSIYSSAFSVLEGVGSGTTGTAGAVTQPAKAAGTVAYAGARPIRQANSIYYYSPTVSGFQFTAGIAPQVDKGSTSDNVGVTEYSLRYTQGPVDIMLGNTAYDVGSNAPANTSTTANTTFNYTGLGAAFAVNPALKLHAGTFISKSKNLATNFAARSNTFGASYNLTPAVAAMFNVAQVNDTSTLNMDRSLTGIGLNYTMSKRTRAYVRYDQIVTDKANENSTQGNKLNRTAVGIAHTF